MTQAECFILVKKNPKAGRDFLLSLPGNGIEKDILYYGLGLSYYFEDETKMAIQHFEKALESNPGFAEVYSYLGLIWMDTDPYLAEGMFLACLSFQPKNGFALFHLGMINEDKILKESVAFADSLDQDSQSMTISDKYYAGLIYNLAGLKNKSISLLSAIMNDFRPAKYQLAGIYKSLTEKQGERDKIIIELGIEETGDYHLYLMGIEPVRPGGDPELFLDEIAYVLYFSEQIETISEVINKPFELKSVFYNGIILDDDENKTAILSLKDDNSRAWEEIVEKQTDPHLLDLQFNSLVQLDEYLIEEFTDRIYKNVFQELLSKQKNYADTDIFDFKLYLALNFRLLRADKISHIEALRIYLYLNYCMYKLPNEIHEEFEKYIKEQVFDLITKSVPYVEQAKKLLKGLEAFSTLIRKKKSPLLKYSTFYKEISDEIPGNTQ